MNDRRRRLFRGVRILICALAVLIPLAGCHGDTPTAPERAVTAGTAPTLTATPTATPTPLPGPLAVVEFALAPARSGFRHAFTVHFDVRETRGIPISVLPMAVWSRSGDYRFPASEGPFQDYRVGAFGSVSFDLLVEHDADIPCDEGLFVGVHVEAADGLKAQFEKEFNCTTGYWPL